MKAVKRIACLSASAVLISLFASGVTVPEPLAATPQTESAAAAAYTEPSLAAYLDEHAFDGTLSGETIALPVADGGETSDMNAPVFHSG